MIRASAHRHPNVVADRELIPGGPSRQWIADMKREYGAESPQYVARVDARFPETAEDALVRGEWLKRSHELHRTWALADDRAPLVVGVDPARLGPDATAVCIRRGAHVLDFETWRGADTMETADRVKGEVRRLFATHGQVEQVIVDEIGLGAGVLDRLKELLPQLMNEAIPQPLQMYRPGRDRLPDPLRRAPRCVGFDGGKRAGDADRFHNLRAQAYWHLRKLLEEGELALPPSPELDEELMETRVQFTNEGRTKIEAKEDLKARIGRSPDLADALAISLRPMLDMGGVRFHIRAGTV